MNSEIVWLLTRQHNAQQLKRNNQTFSTTALLSQSAFKYSSTSKPVSVVSKPKGFQLVLRKKTAAPNKVKGANFVIDFKSANKKSIGNILKKYRADLVGDASLRAERIIKSQGKGKPVKAKKVRGNKK